MSDETTPDTPIAAELVDLTIASDRDADGLSPMERRFAEHALDLIQSGERFWRKEAARRAGYKEPRGAASQLIRRPHIIAYMAGQMTEAAATVKVDRSFVLFRAMTNLAVCEAREDYRTAVRYLDIIARHVDVGAFTVNATAELANAGMMSLPFDPSKLSTDELAAMITLMRKASGGQSAE